MIRSKNHPKLNPEASEERQRWRERLDHESKEAAALGLRTLEGQGDRMVITRGYSWNPKQPVLSRCLVKQNRYSWNLKQL